MLCGCVCVCESQEFEFQFGSRSCYSSREFHCLSEPRNGEVLVRACCSISYIISTLDQHPYHRDRDRDRDPSMLPLPICTVA
jgi:hypothetical protein